MDYGWDMGLDAAWIGEASSLAGMPGCGRPKRLTQPVSEICAAQKQTEMGFGVHVWFAWPVHKKRGKRRDVRNVRTVSANERAFR